MTDVVDAAVEARDDAMTYDVAVGAAVETYDGEVYAGFNIENMYHAGTHAEEMALLNGVADGYRATDFRRLAVVYQDDAVDEDERYPGCLHCQATMWDLTHPYLEIVVADGEGENHLETWLRDEVSGGGGATYPSSTVRAARDRANEQPRLPLATELHGFYEEEEAFQRFCDAVDVTIPDDR